MISMYQTVEFKYKGNLWIGYNNVTKITFFFFVKQVFFFFTQTLSILKLNSRFVMTDKGKLFMIQLHKIFI